MTRYISESLSTPIVDSCDVLIAGGGIAGVSAALSAARNGAKTMLLEREYMTGGLATAGLITYFLPICDGMGNQVSFGIAEELLRLAIAHGAEGDYPDAWLGDAPIEKRKTQRFMARFNAQYFALLLERLLLENGVVIRYGSAVAGIYKSNERVEAAIVESKSGREGIEAKRFVDATGDCNLFALAGAKTEAYKPGNVLAAWYYRLENGKNQLRQLGVADVPDDLKPELGSPEPLCERRFGGLNAPELTEMTLMAHDEILNDLVCAPECEPTALFTIPQVRMTRRISGLCTMREDRSAVYEDRAGYIADWRRRGYAYEVPFSALYGAEFRNLIAAGRCISATDDMWDVTRAIPACAVTGEIAGAAAALTDDFTALDIRTLRRALGQKED